MNLDFFNRKIKKKSDISLVKRGDIKKHSFNLKKKNLRRSLSDLLSDISPLGVQWVLEVPSPNGSEAYVVRTNRPSMRSNYDDVFGYGGRGHGMVAARHIVEDHYIELDNYHESNLLTEWFNSVRGDLGYHPNNKKNLTLMLVNRGGTIEERWSLIGALPTSIQYHCESHLDNNITCGITLSLEHISLTTLSVDHA
jgi:hypothetical protein